MGNKYGQSLSRHASPSHVRIRAVQSGRHVRSLGGREVRHPVRRRRDGRQHQETHVQAGHRRSAGGRCVASTGELRGDCQLRNVVPYLMSNEVNMIMYYVVCLLLCAHTNCESDAGESVEAIAHHTSCVELRRTGK